MLVQCEGGVKHDGLLVACIALGLRRSYFKGHCSQLFKPFVCRREFHFTTSSAATSPAANANIQQPISLKYYMGSLVADYPRPQLCRRHLAKRGFFVLPGRNQGERR